MRKLLLAVSLVAAAAPSVALAETPEQNLDCAIWTSSTMGTTEDKDVQNGLGYALSWFIGLYEGSTGKDIDDAMAARAASMSDAEFAALANPCIARMQAFGARVGRLSERLQAQGN